MTAVFSMGWLTGFDDRILEALKSSDPEIQREAIVAAGRRELHAAGDRIVALVNDPATPKPLLLAAIAAVGEIRPREAGKILAELTDSDDEEIADAAEEAIDSAIIDDGSDEEEDDVEDEDAGKWIN